MEDGGSGAGRRAGGDHHHPRCAGRAGSDSDHLPRAARGRPSRATASCSTTACWSSRCWRRPARRCAAGWWSAVLLKDRKGINLPGVAVSAPALTDKDREDLAFCIDQEVDYVALSFVRRASDVLELKELLLQEKSAMQVIAKIEKPQAVADFDAILEASDGIMVARGDLGVEMQPGEGAADPEADHPQVQRGRQAGDHRHPDAGEHDRASRGRPGPKPPMSPTPSSTAPTRSCSRPRPPRGAIRWRRSR